MTLEDAANHERVVYPNDDDKENAKKAAKAKSEPDVVEMQPGREAPVTIAPRASVTIHLRIAIPKHAGTYSGVIHISANGADPAAFQLTLRSRGPNDWGVCPLVLFLLTLVVGAISAKALEYWFGGGGGLIRARALFSLETSRKALLDLSAWLETLRAKVPNALPRTQSAIDRDLTEIGELFTSERNLKHGQIDERAACSLNVLRSAVRCGTQPFVRTQMPRSSKSSTACRRRERSTRTRMRSKPCFSGSRMKVRP